LAVHARQVKEKPISGIHLTQVAAGRPNFTS